jgi:hypothetical protein
VFVVCLAADAASRVFGVGQFAAVEFRSIVHPLAIFLSQFPLPSKSGERQSRFAGVGHFCSAASSSALLVLLRAPILLEPL